MKLIFEKLTILKFLISDKKKTEIIFKRCFREFKNSKRIFEPSLVKFKRLSIFYSKRTVI